MDYFKRNESLFQTLCVGVLTAQDDGEQFLLPHYGLGGNI